MDVSDGYPASLPGSEARDLIEEFKASDLGGDDSLRYDLTTIVDDPSFLADLKDNIRCELDAMRAEPILYDPFDEPDSEYGSPNDRFGDLVDFVLGREMRK